MIIVGEQSTGQQTVTSGADEDAVGQYPSCDPRSGNTIEWFRDATHNEIDATMAGAQRAFGQWAGTPASARAAALLAVADQLERYRRTLVVTADRETALGEARLDGELTRTQSQLRLFADAVSYGGLPPTVRDHLTVAGQDVSLVRTHVPLGPVVVFAASNFPFAFSVAGTDSASALAVGCPVVVKIHPLHPATSQLTAKVVTEALAGAGAPAGTFAALHGHAAEVGVRLTAHPMTAAVAFTGSPVAGLALARVAGARPAPIPFYGELGSINPVVVCSTAHKNRGAEIADLLAGSMLQGYGQFCTSPGVVLTFGGDGLAADLAGRLGSATPEPMLGERIAESFRHSVRSLEDRGVRQLVPGRSETTPAVFVVTPQEMLSDEGLRAELFGPACVVVPVDGADEVAAVVDALGGQLTGTVFADDDDEVQATLVLASLVRTCGRIVWNGVPTGVAVSPAMHHGGPFPATTDPASTSVGTQALMRFVRPVCLQGVPKNVVGWPDGADHDD